MLYTREGENQLHVKFMVFWNPFPELLQELNLFEDTVSLGNCKEDIKERKRTHWDGSKGKQLSFGLYLLIEK